MNADVATKDASTMPATMVMRPQAASHHPPPSNGRLWADGISSSCDGISAQEDGITDSAADAGERGERQPGRDEGHAGHRGGSALEGVGTSR